MTGAGKALAIIGIILLAFVTLLGCGFLLLFVACDGFSVLTGTKGSSSSDQQALMVILAIGLVFLLGGLGGIIAIARRLRRSGAQAPGLPPPGGPYVTSAPLDVQPLRLAIIAHFVMIAISLALTVIRVMQPTAYSYSSPMKSLIFALIDSVAYAAPYIAVFIFLFQRTIYRRALVVAIVYGFASIFFSLRWLPMLFRGPGGSQAFMGQYMFIWIAGIAIDIWIAIAGIMAFQRFPDRRNAAVEFILFAIAALFYLLIISALSTTFATMVYRG